MEPSIEKTAHPVSTQGGCVRLNKWISHAGICSRREADTLIKKGQISVNGQKLTTLGYKVALTDVVTFRDKVLKPDNNVYILFNKPRSCLTTVYDPQGRRTVLDFVRDACPQRLYPVGRLDYNTTGLLLLTNDGDLTQKLAHPSYQVKKIYQVELATPLHADDLAAIRAGIQLKDGLVQVDCIEILPGDGTKLGIEIHSGKNRVIRRLFEHLEYQLINLDRVLYANLTKKELVRGTWRFLTLQEINYLKYAI